METTEKEIERVRSIHRYLDQFAACYDKQTTGFHTFKIRTLEGELEYTAAEVREWPEMKRKMVEALTRGHDGQVVAVWCDWYNPPGPGLFICEQEHTQVTRGLCLYRSMLPASPAQEAWVPMPKEAMVLPVGAVISARNRTVPQDYTLTTEAAWNGKEMTNGRGTIDGENYEVTGTWMTHYQMPAPMPSGSAGKEEPKRMTFKERIAQANGKREWDSEKHPAPGFWPSLDERIAAARAELDQPTAERRARLSRFDPTPWQDWPKGWDDEP